MVDGSRSMDFLLGDHEWCTPRTCPELDAGYVHIWRFSLSQPEPVYQTMCESLTLDERERADRYRFDDGRRRFVLGRGIFKSILATYLGVKPLEIRFQYGPQGKPLLGKEYAGASLHFNLSHTRDLAVCAFNRLSEIGIDVEHIHPLGEIERVAGRIFSKDDYTLWHSLPEALQLAAFYRSWTLKEAIIKALGYGLSQSMSELSVSPAPDDPAVLVHLNGDREQARDWTIHSFVPETGTIAAFALKAHHTQLACFVWPDRQVMDAQDGQQQTNPRQSAGTIRGIYGDI
ncbi:MAG TPA: 4'-phosphopantetheinyl transferase superfamily protein [Anaerolineae bacterium]